jgi:hypothetical protein
MQGRERNWIGRCSAITIFLMLDDREFCVMVLWGGRSVRYDEKIIILEGTNFICVLYEFYMYFK